MKKVLLISLLLCLIVCVASASAEGLILKGAEGNSLEKGATLSGHYYYKVYVEGVPEDYEGIQTAWVRDVLDAEAPTDWEAIRYLDEDELGRYILVIPVVGADYTQETMFARLDENDTDLVQINFSYDRETVKETEPPTLISEVEPKVGQSDYVLQWSPVEGAEFYEVYGTRLPGTYSIMACSIPNFHCLKWKALWTKPGSIRYTSFPMATVCRLPVGAGRARSRSDQRRRIQT